MQKPRTKINATADLVRSSLTGNFLLDPIPPDPEARYSRGPCLASDCGRISVRKDIDLCRPHHQSFEKSDAGSLEEWLESAPRIARHRDAEFTVGRFDFASCGSSQLRDELAYGLMKRGERGKWTSPEVASALSKALRGHRIVSLVELRHKAVMIEDIAVATGGYSGLVRPFLLDCIDELCLLINVEPTRRYIGDGSAGGSTWINLNRLTSEEFRGSIQRWIDFRIAAELGSADYIQSIGRFVATMCSWLEERGVVRWKQLTRADLLEYLGVINRLQKPGSYARYSDRYRSSIIGGIQNFLDDVAINEWADIPTSARWLRGERPRFISPEPTLMGSNALARLRHPGNLQLIENRDARMAIRIIAETGLRRKDVCAGIRVDSLIDVGGGKWTLTYKNSKSRIKAIKSIPITPELARVVAEHVAYKREVLPGTRNLFAVDRHDRIITLTLINRELSIFIKKLDIRDGAGESVRVTPHMFRHQNASDWLEAGMSLSVIQMLLGHDSMRTTEIYAHISERTVREQWERSIAVNSEGDLIQGPNKAMIDAAWVHAFMGGATQALPNGRCGMPCSQECEHANACLYCPLFITTPEYLPVLREQRDEHRTMMRLAEAEGHQRIVEKNRKPFIALERLIGNLEELRDRELGQAS